MIYLSAITSFLDQVPLGLCHDTCLVHALEVSFGKMCMKDDSLKPASCPSRALGLVWGMFEHRNLAMLLGYAASNIFHRHLFRFRKLK